MRVLVGVSTYNADGAASGDSVLLLTRGRELRGTLFAGRRLWNTTGLVTYFVFPSVPGVNGGLGGGGGGSEVDARSSQEMNTKPIWRQQAGLSMRPLEHGDGWEPASGWGSARAAGRARRMASQSFMPGSTF